MDPPDEPPPETQDEPPAETEPRPPRARDAVLRARAVPRTFPRRARYLRMDLGECRRPASDHVWEELRRLSPQALARYPDPAELREALARLHGTHWRGVAITAGSDDAIRWVFNAFVEEGARVLIPRPSFGAFLAAAEAVGAFVERVDYPDHLEFPHEDFARGLHPRTPRLAVLANPNAPTGTAMDAPQIIELARTSPRTLFLVDEVYVSFHGRSVLDIQSPERGLDLPANLVVLRSFSKDYGLAGMRIGYMVGHPEVIAPIEVVQPTLAVSVPGLCAALAAIADPESMHAQVQQMRSLMNQLVSRLSMLGVEAIATRANFVLVRMSAPIQPWAAAFAAHGVLVGTRGHTGALADYLRVTPTCDQDIDRFLDVLNLVLVQGVSGAASVRGVEGNWDALGEEGMA